MESQSCFQVGIMNELARLEAHPTVLRDVLGGYQMVDSQNASC